MGKHVFYQQHSTMVVARGRHGLKRAGGTIELGVVGTHRVVPDAGALGHKVNSVAAIALVEAMDLKAVLAICAGKPCRQLDLDIGIAGRGARELELKHLVLLDGGHNNASKLSD